MDILNLSKKLQMTAKRYGRYRFVAEKSGVSYEWLAKFANGRIPNPGIESIDKLQKFFASISEDQDAA